MNNKVKLDPSGRFKAWTKKEINTLMSNWNKIGSDKTTKLLKERSEGAVRTQYYKQITNRKSVPVTSVVKPVAVATKVVKTTKATTKVAPLTAKIGKTTTSYNKKTTSPITSNRPITIISGGQRIKVSNVQGSITIEL